MIIANSFREKILDLGYGIIPGIYEKPEVESIKEIIEGSISSLSIESPKGVYAIRRFVHEVPGVWKAIWNSNLRNTVSSIFGGDYRLVKSIYFDKPKDSNWFVSYHQDLTLSIQSKTAQLGYTHWTKKGGTYSVQPPVEILQSNFTVRIHLDDTTEQNGALRVIPKSHELGICRVDDPRLKLESECLCSVSKGGIMIMRPLLMHASSRATSSLRRRVIHLEFSNQDLPEPLEWAEGLNTCG